MLSPVRIREYMPSDHAAVRALFVQINRELAPASMQAEFEAYIKRSLEVEVDRIPAYFAERHGSFWVAELEGRLAGNYGLEMVRAGTAELRRMYVDREVRRRGIGTAMLAHAEAICRGLGFTEITLSTSELQPAAIELYRAAGFEQTGQYVAENGTNKTVGHGIRRFTFRKSVRMGQD
jgi:GNAT superfamily N-acetyltransferase